MNNKLLQLNFSQLESAWKKSKNNLYSDTKKISYHKNLVDLFNKMKEEDFLGLSEIETVERSRVIDFFFISITFLDGSTVSQIPFEIIKCLEEALKDWVDEHDDFIIVTSLVKGINAFSFDTRLTFGDYYIIIEETYGIKFESKLIQINVPEALTRDYLANVALYHELGHFIDRKYRISEILTKKLIFDFRAGKFHIKFYDYFPFLKGADPQTFVNVLFSHFSEYFCDLFAAQYVGKSLGIYLDYITKGNPNHSNSHPATSVRVDVVSKFINGENDVLMDEILSVVVLASRKELKKRYKEFSSTDFENLIPIEINSASELHYLFVYGWNLWLSDWNEFQKVNEMAFPLSPNQIYEIINNLIEKSIGNYIVKTNWEKYKDVSAS
jgi:hypothetical protein